MLKQQSEAALEAKEVKALEAEERRRWMAEFTKLRSYIKRGGAIERVTIAGVTAWTTRTRLGWQFTDEEALHLAWWAVFEAWKAQHRDWKARQPKKRNRR